jgi:DNA (cytosine-5)-methyltransferase 1
MLKGFRTSYKRISPGLPCNTLTTRSDSISSDVKGHPTQNRVLSLREVLIVSSMASWPGVEMPWWRVVGPVFDELPATLIRVLVGESIPPLLMSAIVQHLVGLSLPLQE